MLTMTNLYPEQGEDIEPKSGRDVIGDVPFHSGTRGGDEAMLGCG